MNAWINEMIGRGGLDVSLPDMSVLVPDAKILWIVGAAVAFCIVAGCQEVWFNHRQDRKYDPRRK